MPSHSQMYFLKISRLRFGGEKNILILLISMFGKLHINQICNIEKL